MRKFNIIFIVLLLCCSIKVYSQKSFLVEVKIDSNFNNSTMKITLVLPSFSSIKAPKPKKVLIKDGKFSCKLYANGFELYGFRIEKNGKTYTKLIKILPQHTKIHFLDTLLKNYTIEDHGFDAMHETFGNEIKAVLNDTTKLVNVLEKHIETPSASYFLFSYSDKLPEHRIVSLYNATPIGYRENSWSKDLEILMKKFFIGKQALEFSQKNPEGKSINLSDFKGKYLLLDFWASWCIPCRKENPNLLKVYKKYHQKGFEILAVSLDYDKTDWVKAIKEDGLIWQHVSDLSGWKNKVSKKLYKISSIPSNYLIDPEGVIIEKNLKGNKLTSVLNKLFPEKN